jgi:hypothetical protein
LCCLVSVPAQRNNKQLAFSEHLLCVLSVVRMFTLTHL